MSKFLKLFLIIGFISITTIALAKEIYYCPMHTSYISDHPGNCPLCGMKLVKKMDKVKSEDHNNASFSSVVGYANMQLSPQRQQLAGIKTAVVARQNVIKAIHAQATVAYDYELYKAQVEYVEKYITYKRVSRRLSSGYVVQDAKRQLKLAELELVHMGISESALRKLEEDQFPDHSLVLTNMRGVLVYAYIFEEDLGFVDVGQKAKVEIPVFHEKYDGVVVSVDPMVDPVSRTIRVRINVPNAAGLTANMLAKVDIIFDLNNALVIPRDAVIDTGKQKIVFVKRGDQFQPVAIETGWSAQDMYLVKAGLTGGEEIAVEGNFLLDSESRLQAVAFGGQSHD